MNEERLRQQFKEEFQDLCEDKEGIVVQLSALEAWCALSCLQLSLRHPKNAGPTSEIARAVAKSLEAKVAVTPALKIIAQRGWDPAYDETA
jgi:hypothetical protein